MSQSKIIIAGSEKVGKTALFSHIVNKNGGFSAEYKPTIGMEYGTKTIKFQHRLTLWDTSGQERFQHLKKIVYKDASAVLLCCDLTSRESLAKLTAEVAYIREHANDKNILTIYLVATKIDLDSERQVSNEDLLNFVNANNLTGLHLTSAKTGEGVDKLVNNLAVPLLATEQEEFVDLLDNKQKFNYLPAKAPRFSAKTSGKLFKFYAMFTGYSSNGELHSFSWQQLNPFRGLVKNKDYYPLSKIRRSTLLERLLDTYFVIVGKRSKITLHYPQTLTENEYNPYNEEVKTYQIKFGLLDYLTLGIFPLASTLKSGVWAGFKANYTLWGTLGWGLLCVVVGIPSFFVAFIGNWLLKPFIGIIATALVAPIPIVISVINALTYPNLDNIKVIPEKGSSTSLTLKALVQEQNETLLLTPVVSRNETLEAIEVKSSSGNKIATIKLGYSVENGENNELALDALLKSGFGKFAKTMEKQGLRVNPLETGFVVNKPPEQRYSLM